MARGAWLRRRVIAADGYAPSMPSPPLPSVLPSPRGTHVADSANDWYIDDTGIRLLTPEVCELFLHAFCLFSCMRIYVHRWTETGTITSQDFYKYIYTHVLCVCVCVCVRERERERAGGLGDQGYQGARKHSF